MSLLLFSILMIYTPLLLTGIDIELCFTVCLYTFLPDASNIITNESEVRFCIFIVSSYEVILYGEVADSLYWESNIDPISCMFFPCKCEKGMRLIKKNII